MLKENEFSGKIQNKGGIRCEAILGRVGRDSLLYQKRATKGKSVHMEQRSRQMLFQRMEERRLP